MRVYPIGTLVVISLSKEEYIRLRWALDRAASETDNEEWSDQCNSMLMNLPEALE